MKYLKISFIILIFSIIIFSAANSKVIYVEEGSEEASKSKSKLLTDKVIYKIYNEYEINPIYCLAIFPFEFSKKTKATHQEKENLRKIFYAYISRNSGTIIFFIYYNFFLFYLFNNLF